MTASTPLAPSNLYRRCDETAGPLRSAAELEPLGRSFGRARAGEAARFAFATPGDAKGSLSLLFIRSDGGSLAR